jgi:D-alanine-D-alanine ligase
VPDRSPLPPRVNLVVLFGGQSAEHDVSRATAAHVLAALDERRYHVRAVGITREGRWVDAGDAAVTQLANLRQGQLTDGPAIAAGLEVVGPATHAEPMLASGEPDAPTVVLPLLHGPLGEDGTVQGLLELADVAYVGAGVLSSALSMDKAMAKTVLDAHGIPQARWRAFLEHEIGPTTAADVVEQFGLPLFVKPANMGSSVGVTKAKTVEAVGAAIATALAYDRVVVVEEAVVGREIEVAVLGNELVRASVPGEVIPGHEFYDFDDKYIDGGAKLLIPAHTTWYATFARNAMVLIHTDQSVGAREINGRNWWRVLLRPGVRSGHSDPALDPNGYRTLMVFQLAEAHYRQPGLDRRLRAADRQAVAQALQDEPGGRQNRRVEVSDTDY